MKTIKRILSLIAALCLTMTMSAQYLYDASGGTTIGKISGNNIYDASGGTTIGRINGERIMDGSGGRTLNHIKSDGRVMDSSGGYVVGYIRSNGQVMDKTNGHTLGYVENGNVYDSSHGNKIGQYRGVEAKYAAYFYFFFPNKKQTPTAAKKPANTTPQKVTNALTPKPKGISLYDRDMRKMGTFWDNDRFVSTVTNGFLFTFKKTDEGIIVHDRGKYLCTLGKDNKIYYNEGKSVYAIIDEKGNAFSEDGEQYGILREDGEVFINRNGEQNIPFGHIKDKDYDRQLMGVLYFVCYYTPLIGIYEKLDKEKEKKDSIGD
ncbi:MAG: hypothetical protein J6Z14_11965 [Prevotella sp.]|nr:hypothetical protein [Prevotella sp.]